MNQFLSRSELHTLLRDQGHAFWSATPDETPICVSPPVETYMTVALEPDGALKRAYRNRYFACLSDENDEPLILHDSAFELREPFATVAERRPTNNLFMLGPFRWFLVRVRRFSRLLLWPKEGGYGGNDGFSFLLTGSDGKPLAELPALAQMFERLHPDQFDGGALRLEMANVADAEILWEAADLVGRDVYDFYICDESGKEVYLLHHHDKIVVSIPDSELRDMLLVELVELDQLFENCSGYRSTGD